MPLWSKDTYDTIIRENDRMCVGCNKFKLWKEFQRSNGPNGRDSRCKVCRSREKHEKYISDPEYRQRKLEAGRVWAGQKPEVMARLKRRFLLRRYSLTPEAFDRILKLQNGRCPICSVELERSNWNVDHIHLPDGMDGKVRGILCSGCNQGLGNFRDDIEKLKAAIRYLENQNG